MPDLVKEEIASGIAEERADLENSVLNSRRIKTVNSEANLVYFNDYFVSI